MVARGHRPVIGLGWLVVLGLPVIVLVWAVCRPDDRS